jgi:hypothetical protein
VPPTGGAPGSRQHSWLPYWGNTLRRGRPYPHAYGVQPVSRPVRVVLRCRFKSCTSCGNGGRSPYPAGLSCYPDRLYGPPGPGKLSQAGKLYHLGNQVASVVSYAQVCGDAGGLVAQHHGQTAQMYASRGRDAGVHGPYVGCCQSRELPLPSSISSPYNEEHAMSTPPPPLSLRLLGYYTWRGAWQCPDRRDVPHWTQRLPLPAEQSLWRRLHHGAQDWLQLGVSLRPALSRPVGDHDKPATEPGATLHRLWPAYMLFVGPVVAVQAYSAPAISPPG